MFRHIPKISAFIVSIVLIGGGFHCSDSEDEIGTLEIQSIHIGLQSVEANAGLITDVNTDEQIVIQFSSIVDESLLNSSISINSEDNREPKISLSNGGRTLRISPDDLWLNHTTYSVTISSNLKSITGGAFEGLSFEFETKRGELTISSIRIDESELSLQNHVRTQNVDLSPTITYYFSNEVDANSLVGNVRLNAAPITSYDLSDDGQSIEILLNGLKDFSKYNLSFTDKIEGVNEEDFEGHELIFYTGESDIDKFSRIPTEELLTKVQEQTFKYFWEFAHPVSGLIRERNTSDNLVTIGGSGFGILSILVGIERNFITRDEGLNRIGTIVEFLAGADRFHGAWPHWMDGTTGKVIPFSPNDNGADLVETAFMIQGLLSARAYLNEQQPEELSLIESITKLWHEVEWNWFTQDGKEQLFWHWSPDLEWRINLPIRGYNEALMVYILASASPTFSVEKAVYDVGWTRDGQFVNGKEYYDYKLPFGPNLGGPLFFEHYTFQSLDPRALTDTYGSYWDQVVNHSLINHAYCSQNPKGHVGYSEKCWGLTASDSHNGYSAHSPTNDLGVITPTAALSSFPYSPEASLGALEFFYYKLGDRLWGEYGFYDAFSLTEQWTANSFLAIDQGPIINMIENYRTGLLWQLFMSDTDIQNGLKKLEFNF